MVLCVAGAFTLGAVPVLADGHDFGVEIDAVDDTVTAGDAIDVTVQVTNHNAGNQATETVALRVDGTEEDTATTGPLDTGESETIDLSYVTTESDVGDLDVAVNGTDRTDTETVAVVEAEHHLTVDVEDQDGDSVTAPVTIDGSAAGLPTTLTAPDTLSLPNGTYDVSSSPDGYSSNQTSVTVAGADQSVTLTVEEETVDVSGTVTDAETGQGLENATIRVDDQTVGQSASDGSFGVSEGGNYTLTVTHEGYATEEREIQGNESNVAVALEPLDGSVSGEVILGADTGVQDVTVTVDNDADSFSQTLSAVDQQAEYSFAVPRAGDHSSASSAYNVTVDADGFENVSVSDVEVAPGEDVTLDAVVLGGQNASLVVELRDQAGTSLDGVTVTAADADGEVTATTNATGYATFDLAPGTYDVSADPADHAQVTDTVTLAPGENRTTTLTTAADAGSITGTVTLDEPALSDDLQGLTVEATNGTETYSVVRDVNDGEDAIEYVIENVPAGTYNVTASLAAYDGDTETSVVVPPNGEASDVDLALAAPTGSLDVTVTDATDGSDVENADVTATVTDVDTENATLTTATETTDANGEASFAGLRTGTYDVTIDHADYEPVEETVTVENATTVTLDVSLGAQDGNLSGSVTLDEPVLNDGLDVAIEVVADGGSGSVVAETTETLDAGETSLEYAFDAVPADDQDYAVAASAPGYDGDDTQVTIGPADSVVADALTLQAHTGSIDLSATDAFNGTGVPDATVTAELANVDLRDTDPDAVTWSAETGPGGTASLADLRVGTYELTVDHPDYETATVSGVEVTDGATSEPSVALDGLPGTIEGTVVRDDGEPIPDATVTVDGESVATDGDGAFTLEDVDRGDHAVTANADGFHENETTVTVGPNETVSAPIELTGIVENEDSGYTYGSIQTAIDADETQDGHTIAVPNGTFDEQVDVTKGVTISGAGAPADANDLDDGEHTIVDGAGNPAQFDVTADGAGIEGIAFDGDEADIAVRSRADDTTVANVLVDGHAGPGVLLSAGTGGELDAVAVQDAGGTAVQLSDRVGATVTDLTVSGDDEVPTGIAIDGGENNDLSGVDVSDARVGAALTGGTASNVIDLEDVSASDTALDLDDATGNVITATEITDANVGIALADADDNEFDLEGEISGATALSIENSDDNVVEAESIQSDASVGLELANAHGNEFSVDSIDVDEQNKGPTSVGIQLLGANDNSFAGLNEDLTLEDFNTGVLLDDGATGNQFTNVEISETTGVETGVIVREATANEFQGTVVDMNDGGDGIHLFEGATNNTFEDTLVQDADVGAHLEGADENTFDGLAVDVGDHTVETAVLLEDGADANLVGGLTVEHELSVDTAVEVLTSEDNVVTDAAIQFTGEDAIVLDRADNTTVADSVIDRSGGNGIYVTDLADDESTGSPVETTDVSIESTTITNGEQNGVLLDGDATAGVVGTAINDSTIEHNAEHAVRGTYAHQGHLENNTINENDAHAVYFTDSDANAFVENQISSNATDLHGVLLERSPDTTMDGDVVTNSDSGVKITDESDDTTLTGVTASDNDANGVWVTEESTGVTIQDGWVENNTVGVLFDATDVGTHAVSNNTIANNAEQGVFVDAVDDNVIAENAIDANGAEGVLLSETVENTLSANDVTANNASGIVLAGANDNVIEDNNVSENAPHGIHLTDSHDNAFEANEITQNDQEGVLLESASTSNEFLDDVVTGNERGVDVTQSSDDTTLTGVTASENAEEGVRVTGSTDATIQDGSVENNTVGVLFTDTEIGNHEVSNTLVANNAEQGILVDRVADNEFTGNEIQANGLGGVLVDGADDNAFANNVVTDHGEEDGVLLVGASDTTFDGDAVENNAAGVNVTASSDDTDLFDVTATDNDRGVHVLDSANATVEESTFESNGVGVLLEGGDTGHEVFANTFTGDGVSIHVLESANNVIDDNDVADATDTGVHVQAASDTLLVDNEITDTDGDGVLLQDAAASNLTANLVANNDAGVNVTDGTSETVIEAVEANENDVGVLVRDASANATVANTTVANGTFDSNEVGVELAGADESQVVRDNAISYTTDAGIHLVDADGNALSANDVGYATTGIHLENADANQVEGGTITQTTVGVQVANGSGNAVEGVTVEFSDEVGIAVTNATENTVEGGELLGNPVGVRLQSAGNNVVLKNTVTSGDGPPGEVGIQLRSADGNAFGENLIRFQEVGVSVNASSGNVFANSTLEDNERVGVQVLAGSNGTVLENLTATANGPDDVTDISDPEAALTTGGVAVAGGNDTLVANGTFRENGPGGVLVTGGADHVVHGNAMTDQLLGVGAVGDLDDGLAPPSIDLDAPHRDVEGATIEDNDVTGHAAGIVLVSTTDASVVNNDVSEGSADQTQSLADDLGVTIPDGIDDPTLGIADVSSTGTTATGNDVSDVGVGVAVGDTQSVTLSGGSVTDTTLGVGVVYDAADTTVADVTIENTDRVGLTVQGATNTHVEGGTILDSGEDDVRVDDADGTTADALALENETVSFAANDVTLVSVEPVTPGPGADVSVGAGLNATYLSEDGWIDLGVHYGDVADDVADGTLSIYRFDGNWTALPSDVDANAHVVSANVTSFSHFGAFGSESAPEPDPDPEPEPEPEPEAGGGGGGALEPPGDPPELLGTSLDPGTVEPGETVLVNATYAGNGGGDVNATLSIDGEIVDYHFVHVSEDANHTVTFEHTFEEEGEYPVVASGEDTGTVTVSVPDDTGEQTDETPTATETTPTESPTATPDAGGAPTPQDDGTGLPLVPLGVLILALAIVAVSGLALSRRR